MLELTITFTASHRDQVHSVLNSAGILALVEGTAGTNLSHTDDTVTCYPDSPEHEQRIRHDLLAALANDNRLTFSTAVSDTDWASAWKEDWKPIQVTDRLWISPSWCEFTPPAGSQTIWLDTTTAFGTGTHETTRLCLRLIEQHLDPAIHKSFLDVGCGSGVLSIYARLRGVAKVYGVDIDPQAIETAVENGRRNRCEDIKFLTARAENINLAASFVAANILSGVIQDSWKAISRAVEPGGSLILSGILIEEARTSIAGASNYSGASSN